MAEADVRSVGVWSHADTNIIELVDSCCSISPPCLTQSTRLFKLEAGSNPMILQLLWFCGFFVSSLDYGVFDRALTGGVLVIHDVHIGPSVDIISCIHRQPVIDKLAVWHQFPFLM